VSSLSSRTSWVGGEPALCFQLRQLEDSELVWKGFAGQGVWSFSCLIQIKPLLQRLSFSGGDGSKCLSLLALIWKQPATSSSMRIPAYIYVSHSLLTISLGSHSCFFSLPTIITYIYGTIWVMLRTHAGTMGCHLHPFFSDGMMGRWDFHTAVGLSLQVACLILNAGTAGAHHSCSRRLGEGKKGLFCAWRSCHLSSSLLSFMPLFIY
jgi:hypothetical protein